MRVMNLVVLLLCGATSTLQDAAYFPIRKSAGDPGITEHEAKRYAKSLSRMNEPRLPELAKDEGAVVYRITILPTWGNPIAIRARSHEGVFSLTARRLDGQGGYDPGKLVEEQEVRLKDADSKSLESILEALRFFEMSTDDDTQGTDGDEWVLEGVSRGKYHVVQRWCASSVDPQERGLEPFLAVCRFLVDNSTLSERPRNKGNEILSRLSSADAIRIATDVAKARGIDPGKFHKPTARYDRGQWLVFFASSQVPVYTGDHFRVHIDDKSGESRFAGGA